ncbi:hypothetical protein MEO93_26385 [Dolichospermum sp. ST_sed3]|nr:hypothetical protein [Dolichospermum sp. ST_sed3]
MNSEKETLTPEQSLEVITSMIRQAKGNMQKNSFYFLLWGWTIVIANLGVYFLIQFDIPNPYLMFLITIVAAIVSIIYGTQQGKRAATQTHLDIIYKWLWMGFGITCFIFWFFGKQISWQINPVLITLLGVPTFISGTMLRFKPLMFGGVSFWVFGSVLFLVNTEVQFLLAALAVTIGYLVPGYLLKKSEA